MDIYDYRHTFKGMLGRMYEYMRRRVAGKTNKAHIYKGLSLTSRDRFYDFAMKSQQLKRLYRIWDLNGFQLALRPTPHRVNSARGYQLSNIKFVNYSKNSKMIKRRKK